MGRHEAYRPTLGTKLFSPIGRILSKFGFRYLSRTLKARKNWGFALSASMVLVTVVDPYSGTLAAYASEQKYVNYFDKVNVETPVTVQLARGGYEVLTGSAASKVFVELADIPTAGTVQAIAYRKLGNYGWGRDQYSCLVKLWNRESNWRINAYNSSSGAYGIPQALPGNKMATAGPDWMTNPETQINWGLDYISARYGSPCSALGHSDQQHWY